MCTRTSGRPAHLPTPAVSPEGSGTLAVSRDGNGWRGRLSLWASFSFSAFTSCECIVYLDGYFFRPLFCL